MPLAPSLRKAVTSGFLISLALSSFTPAAFAESSNGDEKGLPPVETTEATKVAQAPEPSAIPTASEEAQSTKDVTPATPLAEEKRYIIRYEKDANAEEESKALKNKGLEIKDTMTEAIEASVVMATPKEIEEVKKSDDVVSVELDYKVSVASATNIWGVDRVDQRVGRDGQYNVPDGGAGVDVYVVDTGINPYHVEFTNRIPQAWSGVYDGRGFHDCSGHGTHVSGTIAGTTYGVAKKANIIPVRTLDCNGQGWASTIMAGIDWAVSYHQPGQPAVMNLSIGGFVGAAFDQTVQSATNDGITVVAAAGNANQDACLTSPAKVGSAITVGATDIWDNMWSGSNYGPCVDVLAPGVGIVSAWIGSSTAPWTTGGTSMAAPHVSGAAAILLSQNRSMSPAQVHNSVVANATTGVINNLKWATPNRLLYIPSTTVAPPTITDMEVADYTTNATLNMRSGPGTHHGIVAVANPGTVVNGTGRRSDVWFEVRMNGQTGWMHSDYLTKVIPAPAPVVIAPVTSSVPTIAGTVTVGSVLTANAGSWGPEGVALAYQWKVDGQAIAGATASTYTISGDYVGKTLSVTVTGSKEGTESKAETSANSAVVQKGSLKTTGAFITGTAKVGYRLTASHAAWGPEPVAMSYQWYRSGVAITGATASSYVLTGADAGKTMTVRVIGRKTGYTAVYRQSAATVAVVAGDLKGETPKVTGTPKVDYALTAYPGLWTAGTTVSYQWYRNGIAIPGATSKYFTITDADFGKQLKVRVTGKKEGYISRAYYSLSTSVITY